MSSSGCLLLICGLPSSGKSLLTNNLVKYSRQNPIDFFGNECPAVFYKISIDELIPVKEQSIKIQTNSGFWRQFRHRLRIAIKLLVKQLKASDVAIDEAIDDEVKGLLELIRSQNNVSNADTLFQINRDFVLIIDDNLYYKSMRYECFQTSKQFGLGFAIIMINCDLELGLSRNRLRPDDRRLPEDVIIKMSERFECPKAEGFECRTYFVSSDTFDFVITEDIIHFISDAIRNPVIDTTLSLTPVEDRVAPNT